MRRTDRVHATLGALVLPHTGCTYRYQGNFDTQSALLPETQISAGWRAACSLRYFSTFRSSSDFYLSLAGDWEVVSAVTISLITQGGNEPVAATSSQPPLPQSAHRRESVDYISHQALRCPPLSLGSQGRGREGRSPPVRSRAPWQLLMRMEHSVQSCGCSLQKNGDLLAFNGAAIPSRNCTLPVRALGSRPGPAFALRALSDVQNPLAGFLDPAATGRCGVCYRPWPKSGTPLPPTPASPPATRPLSLLSSPCPVRTGSDSVVVPSAHSSTPARKGHPCSVASLSLRACCRAWAWQPSAGAALDWALAC